MFVSKYIYLLILSLFLFINAQSVYAQKAEKDNLYIFVFKEGLVQKNITVLAGDEVAITDQYGFAKFALAPNDYTVSYAVDGAVFAETAITIAGTISSQIILNLNDNDADAILDLPLSELEQNFKIDEIKEMEGPLGRLQIRVTNDITDEPIAAAKVFFRDYTFEAESDATGLIDVEVAIDNYSLSFIHPEYVLKVLKDISVTEGETTTIEVRLTESEFVLEDYVVTAPFVEGSIASSLAAMKERDVFAESISSEQFSKSGDSSASSALARATGVTIQDDKVIIRGLNERYTNVLMNGLNVPSSDPTRRVVSLDVFPTSVIESLDIQKTYSADLPGSFGGGTVNIFTKDIPIEDNYVRGSIGTAFDGGYGETALYNADNGNALPASLIEYSNNFGVLTESIPSLNVPGLTAAEKDQLNRDIVNYRDYGLSEKKIETGQSASLSAGQRYRTNDGTSYGFTAALNYKTNNEYLDDVSRTEYRFDPDTGESLLLTDTSDADVLELKESLNGLLSLAVEPSDTSKYKYTFLYVDKANDTTVFSDENDLVENIVSQRTLLEYSEENLQLHQFSGEHKYGNPNGPDLFDNVNFDWSFEVGEAARLEPGSFEYEYRLLGDEYIVDATELYYLYSDLEDSVLNFRLDFTFPFINSGNENYTKVGFFNFNKDRSLDNRRFRIKYDNSADPSDIDTALSEENVDNGLIEVLDAYRPADFYTAEQIVTAFYVNQNYSLTDKLDMTAGIRIENSNQTLAVGANAEEFELDASGTLPALLMSYELNEEQRLRFGYSQTLSRPDFREFSPNRYRDPLTDNIVFGFEGLESTTISNIDLVYEIFPSFDELYSFGYFIKEFQNPIEIVRERADEDIQVSYRNAEDAYSTGVELILRKNLENFSSSLKNYFVSLNHAIIDSEININKAANAGDSFIADLTSDERPLQGQSDYVTNLIFGYDNFFTKRSVIFLYNVFGERITQLGIQGNPDIYEQPFQELNMVVKWRLNDTFDVQEKKTAYEISFKADNLLDSEREYTQGNETVLKYKPGQSYSLNFSVSY